MASILIGPGSVKWAAPGWHWSESTGRRWMILYRLQCGNGHEFDAWFQNSAAYDTQAQAGLVECADCGTPDVQKAIMAPRVARSSKSGQDPKAPTERKQPVFSETPQSKWGRMAAALRDHVEKNFDYVGPRFAEEARNIHYGEAEERSIYGEASPDETKELLDEGISVAPLPLAPKKGTN